MSRFRVAVSLASLAAVVFSTVSCNRDAATDSSGPQIGFSQAFLTDPFQVKMARQIVGQAEDQSINLLPAVDAAGDPAKQNDDINTLLGRNIKGLLVTVADADAVAPVLSRAASQNVPVVAVDLAPAGEVSMIVQADNVLMADSACRVLGDQMGGSGVALNLQGDLRVTNGRERSDGFTQCMAEDFPGITIVSKPFDWSPEKCVEQVQTVLSTTQIDGIYMASEIGCLAAVRKALESQGRWVPAGEPGHLPTVGIDGSAEALEAVRAGTVDAVISQPMNEYAKWAVHYVKAASAGETFEVGPTDHGSRIVEDGPSLKDLLPAPTVTLDNVDDPSLWGNQ